MSHTHCSQEQPPQPTPEWEAQPAPPDGHQPQSTWQVSQNSDPLHEPSPQKGHGPQSCEHVLHVSVPLHEPSPQYGPHALQSYCASSTQRLSHEVLQHQVSPTSLHTQSSTDSVSQPGLEWVEQQAPLQEPHWSASPAQMLSHSTSQQNGSKSHTHDVTDAFEQPMVELGMQHEPEHEYVPPHAPAEQTSLLVHGLPSLHGAVLFGLLQAPDDGVQTSLVHGLLSLHDFAAPALQPPPEHTSFSVHWLPSLHGAVLLVNTHPVAALHESLVQTLPSLQTSAPVPTHVPREHLSVVVQALLSLHGATLFEWTQPLAGLQLSSVHTLPSLQLGAGPPTHFPAEHLSAVVQALPSSHAFVLFVNTHPVAVLQLSFVHGLPSLQVGAGPPTQLPPLHVSFVVHALPSLQGTVLFVKTHPVAVEHESLVHGLPSLHTSAAPPLHTPAAQASLVVHALPSSHVPAMFAWAHPLAGTHESFVQTLLSLQLRVPLPTHTPFWHVSVGVQAFPSLQDPVFGV